MNSASTLHLNKLPLNKRGPIDSQYVVGFKKEVETLYARSPASALQKAVEHFKPKKREMAEVWVTLNKRP